ncbi:MAG: glucose 1-dehydrogenase [Rhizobiaceae bacterium]|nr:glucose 1-dehydrogenase [Rhizobiaceae bacterium]
MRLAGKVAMITGATRGIGLSIARRYAGEGAVVLVVGRDQERCDAAAASIRAAGGVAYGIAADVSHIAGHKALVKAAVAWAGGVDILVNNAGVVDIEPLDRITERSWDSVWNTNVKGLVFLMQAVARQMISQGRGGRIINIASESGRRGEKFCLSYGASKAALIHITQSAAYELAEHGITVNGIAPGVVDTEMWDKVDRQLAGLYGRAPGESRRMAEAAVPLGRFGRPQDIDGAAVFLASADADYITAQTLNVDGGNVPS